MNTTAKLRTAIYMRVSTADQCVDSQRQELLQFIEKREELLSMIWGMEEQIMGHEGGMS